MIWARGPLKTQWCSLITYQLFLRSLRSTAQTLCRQSMLLGLLLPMKMGWQRSAIRIGPICILFMYAEKPISLCIEVVKQQRSFRRASTIGELC